MLATGAVSGLSLCLRGAPQWGEQTAYIRHTWKVGSIVAAFFVLFNLLFQLIPAAAILVARDEKQKTIVKVGIGCLLAVMLVQTLAYSVLWNYQFFARNFAVGVRYLCTQQYGAHAAVVFLP